MKAKLQKTLIIGLNYLPEPTGIAPYTAKMACALKNRGFDVKVLTGYPHYPQWKVAEGYTGLRMRETVEGVSVERLRHPVPRNNGTISRTLMEIIFGLHASLRRWDHPQVVVTVSPALFASTFAVAKAKILGIPSGVWVQDIYARGLAETKGESNKMVRFMKAIESRTFRQADGVAVIHERFRAYVISELKVPADRVRVIRNWTHIPTQVETDRRAIRAQMGWAEDEFVVLHAGNMGVKQGLEHVVRSAKSAVGTPVRLVLMGDGNQRRKLEDLATGLDRVNIIDSVSDELYPQVLRASDALLVNELPGLREMSVPSKLTSYLSTGRPVIASTDAESSTADEVRASRGGVLVDPASETAIVEAALTLKADEALTESLGRAGQQYVAEVLAESAAVDSFEEWAADLASTS